MDLSPKNFSTPDYVIFALMLATSTAVGFYFAVTDRKKQNTEEYLVGGRSMNAYLVAFSLSVGFMSSVLVLGSTADVYRFGTMYAWFILGFLIATIVTAEAFIPIFYRLKLTSVYEYLELRFNRPVRYFGTLLYLVQNVLYIGIVIYAPALALNAVTGFNLWGAVLSTGAICIVYSSLGGLKAVIWTDAIQAIFMITGFVSIIIQGSIRLGGFGNVYRRCEEGGRAILLNFDVDPRVRHSFWSTSVGMTFLGLSLYAVNQGQVQRYLSCKSVNDAKKAIGLNWIGLLFFNGFAVMVGMVMFAYYQNCDPVILELIQSPDQILPFLVLDIFQNNPGMPGVFLACVYAGCLSTVSTAITGLSTVTVQDFIRPWFNWKESVYCWISRGLIVFYGIICIIFAYLTSQLGAILQAAVSVLGLVGGPLVGIYSLGMLFPFANSWGAMLGSSTGLAINIWILIGSKIYPPPPQYYQLLTFATSACPNVTHNVTTTPMTSPIITTTHDVTTNSLVTDERPPVADLYAMSYIYSSALGWIVTVVVGVIVSLVTCGHRNRKKVNSKLIHPFFDHVIFCWLPIGARKTCRCGVEDERECKADEADVECQANDNPAYIYDQSSKL